METNAETTAWSRPTPTSTDAWRAVVDDLQPNQRAWLAASDPVTLHERPAIIAVPDDFTRNQLEGRLRAQLEERLTAVFGREIRIGVTVNPALVADRAAARAAVPESRRADTSISHMSTCRR